MACKNTFRADSKIEDRAILHVEKEHHFDVYQQTGATLRSMESQTSKLIEFLHRNYPIRIEQSVLDFIRDENNQLWLIGLKHVKVDEAILYSAPIDWKKDSNVTAQCKLCLTWNSR